MSELDPITLEVLRHACEAVADEMTATLVRTAYSPNITERRDCSCALFDAAGAMISQSETIPVHLGAMPFSVAKTLEHFDPAELSPGDALLANDPFTGGAHLPDLTLLRPVFVEDDLVAFCANRAHHADIGGAAGGSISPDTTEIYQEGLRIPPVKLVEGGTVNEAVEALLFANVRTPDERRGDLRAQRAANQTGRDRLHELIDHHGLDTVRTAFEAIPDYSERRMRNELEDIPDGTYRAIDRLDDDGQGRLDIPIAVRIDITEDAATIDFAGSAEQVPGPVNAPFAVTASATYYAFRCLTDPDIPANAGCYRPLTIDTPSGSLVDARPPAAVVGGNLEVSQRVVDVVFQAIGSELPERAVAASQGTMNNVTFAGVDPRTDSPYAFYETEAGGHGAHADGDGMDAVQVHMTNTMNTPVEMVETRYPLRIERYTLRPDSAGPGEYRGGLGLRRDVRIRDHEATVSLLCDRRRNAPPGLAGGEPGATGENWLLDGDGAEELPGKWAATIPSGSIISIRTPGGGGFGDPADRDPELIESDLTLGKLSPEHVRSEYGYDADQGSAE